jgi:hypothetical protein
MELRENDMRMQFLAILIVTSTVIAACTQAPNGIATATQSLKNTKNRNTINIPPMTRIVADALFEDTQREEIMKLIDEENYIAALNLIDTEGTLLWTIPAAERKNLSPQELKHIWVEVLSTKIEDVDKGKAKIAEIDKIIAAKRAEGQDTAADEKAKKGIPAYVSRIAAEPRYGNVCSRLASEDTIISFLIKEGVDDQHLPDVLALYEAKSDELLDPQKSPFASTWPFLPADIMQRVNVSGNNRDGWTVELTKHANPYMSKREKCDSR